PPDLEPGRSTRARRPSTPARGRRRRGRTAGRRRRFRACARRSSRHPRKRTAVEVVGVGQLTFGTEARLRRRCVKRRRRRSRTTLYRFTAFPRNSFARLDPLICDVGGVDLRCWAPVNLPTVAMLGGTRERREVTVG